MPPLEGPKKVVAIGLFVVALLVFMVMLQAVEKDDFGAVVTCLSIIAALAAAVIGMRWG